VECDRSLAPIRGLELTAVLDAVWRTIASSKQLGKVVTGNDGCLIDLIIISVGWNIRRPLVKKSICSRGSRSVQPWIHDVSPNR
jgi:hypothetical protein